ncbi:hypothetical protein CHU95_10025 [Niveispirillum lacus]|uniref:Uncharacterized protein n=1 Tax=Niveispirillum lacus TaxID=1981099 RepID=A0A255Z088_9PROT|nr:hypothetical protein [Niveispirillum lacus]OYQ34907.1 hypothetical protein CHU95_10025 [Niveispirillum lacus]
MKLKRAYTAEPVSDETIRRLKMGRTRTRMIGLIAAGIGALIVPAWIAGVGMGYFKLEQKTIAVFPTLLSEEEAKAQAEKVRQEAEAFRQQKPTEEKKP